MLYWQSADGQVGVLNVTDFTKDEFNLIPIDLTVNGIRTDDNKFFMPVLEICPIAIRVGVDDVNMKICDDDYSNLIWYGKILTPIVAGTDHTFYVKLLKVDSHNVKLEFSTNNCVFYLEFVMIGILKN